MRKTISFTCDEVTISSNRSTSEVLVYPNDANIDEIFEDLSITDVVDLCDRDDLLNEIAATFTISEVLDRFAISEAVSYLEDRGYSVKEGEE